MLATGKLAPGAPLSTRGLAQQLGVSQMPAREALSRLAAEGAIAIHSKRQIKVPDMTPDRLNEVMDCRLLLEPEAAVAALPHINKEMLGQLEMIDAQLDEALERGDLNQYMDSNFRFHFAIYGAGGTTLLKRLIETLWLQFGPMMRVVYGRVGTVALVDCHAMAIDAIRRGDGVALHDAIRRDILDGMKLITGQAKASETTSDSRSAQQRLDPQRSDRIADRRMARRPKSIKSNTHA